MDFAAWYTLGVVGLLVAALMSGRMAADTAMLGALTLLMIAGVVDITSAVSGFGHPSVLMLAALFVVAAGPSETGATIVLSRRMLGRPQSLRGALFRLTVPVSCMSAFMNNTAIVAIYLPIVDDWARKLRISPSKLFMPLSFAAILGGGCTIIGTSTNLAINGLYVEYVQNHAAELKAAFGVVEPSLGKQFWWVGAAGVPIAVLGLAFITLFAGRILPERRTAASNEVENRRYTVEVMVEPGSPLIGKSIEEAGLRHLPGLFLTEIEREGTVRQAVGPEELLESDDRLVFVGVIESVVDLLKIRGLTPATDQARKIEAHRTQRTIVEAVVSHNSPLVRRTVRQSQFRTRYNAAIIAVHRGGQRVTGKIGDIVLQPGDTLLLTTHQGFLEAYRNSDHFYLVSGVDGAREVRHERAWLSIGIMAGLVVLLTIPTEKLFGHAIPPVAAGFAAAMGMVVTRCVTGTIARKSVNWQVLLIIGAAIGIGRAMDQSGAANGIASVIFSVVGPMGGYAAIAGLFIVTNVMSQLITNKGAAILMFPITIAVAADMELSPEPFIVTLMVAAACSFITPVGFVTNLMVAGPGGYRFSDFLRLGLPLTLIAGTLCVVLAPLAFPFNPNNTGASQETHLPSRSHLREASASSIWFDEPASPMVRSPSIGGGLGGVIPVPVEVRSGVHPDLTRCIFAPRNGDNSA